MFDDSSDFMLGSSVPVWITVNNSRNSRYTSRATHCLRNEAALSEKLQALSGHTKCRSSRGSACDQFASFSLFLQRRITLERFPWSRVLQIASRLRFSPLVKDFYKKSGSKPQRFEVNFVPCFKRLGTRSGYIIARPALICQIKFGKLLLSRSDRSANRLLEKLCGDAKRCLEHWNYSGKHRTSFAEIQSREREKPTFLWVPGKLSEPSGKTPRNAIMIRMFYNMFCNKRAIGFN